jgi:hypothetical protein
LTIVGPSGQIGFGTSTNLSANLHIQGNVYASNQLNTVNVTTSGTIYYNEDLTKRSIHLLPTTANATTIQSWISATCNAASQPSQAYWCSSFAPIYGNVVSGAQGSFDYDGAVMLGDGRVLFVPYSASNVGFFNPFTKQFTTVSPSGLSSAAGKFKGGTLLPNGNVVFFPYSQSNVGLFDPINMTFSNLNFGYTGSVPFQGGTLTPNGNVVLAPRDSANIAVINPQLVTSTNVGPLFGLNGTKFGGALLLPNGNVVFSPLFSGNIGMYNTYSLTPSAYSNVGPVKAAGSSTRYMEGACLAPNGNVVFTPTTTPGNVIVYDPTVVSSPLAGSAFTNISSTASGSQPFMGSGILLPSGNIFLPAVDSSNCAMIDPVALTFSNSTFLGTDLGKFQSGCLLPDGQIVMSPYLRQNVGVITTLLTSPPEFCMSPYFNKF